jgi:hypothetical protein
MPSEKNTGKGLKRALYVGLGVTFGAAMLLLRRNKDGKENAGEGKAPVKAMTNREEIALTAPEVKKKAITVTEEKPRAITQAEVPLKLKVTPAKFQRGKEAKVVAATAPGASCIMDAVYSTRRKPSGLDVGPHIAEGDGGVEWVWNVSTTGDSVELTVTATLEGYTTATVTRSVPVVD